MNIERDAEITRRIIEGGETLRKVGRDYGLSGERVRQIVRSVDPVGYAKTHSYNPDPEVILASREMFAKTLELKSYMRLPTSLVAREVGSGFFLVDQYLSGKFLSTTFRAHKGEDIARAVLAEAEKMQRTLPALMEAVKDTLAKLDSLK